MKRKLIIAILFTLPILSGCDDTNISNPIDVEIGNDEMFNEIIAVLDEHQLPYQIISNDKILIENKDARFVLAELNQIHSRLLPDGLSFIIDDKYLAYVQNGLEMKDIPFKTTFYDGMNFIVLGDDAYVSSLNKLYQEAKSAIDFK